MKNYFDTEFTEKKSHLLSYLRKLPALHCDEKLVADLIAETFYYQLDKDQLNDKFNELSKDTRTRFMSAYRNAKHKAAKPKLSKQAQEPHAKTTVADFDTNQLLIELTNRGFVVKPIDEAVAEQKAERKAAASAKAIADYVDEELLIELDKRGYDCSTLQVKDYPRKQAHIKQYEFETDKNIAQNLAEIFNKEVWCAASYEEFLLFFKTHVKTANPRKNVDDGLVMDYVFTDDSTICMLTTYH